MANAIGFLLIALLVMTVVGLVGNVLAKTLHATAADRVADRRGISHDWRAELLEQLGQTQDADGSWINRRNGRWLENQPVLVTAYCVLALQEMQP